MTTRIPRPPLDAFVELIWLMPGGGHGETPVLALPTGTVELVVPLDAAPIRDRAGAGEEPASIDARPVLCGAHAQPFVIEGGAAGRTVGVHFRPGGAAALLPVAVHETANQRCDLECVIGAHAHQLHERLLLAGDDDARILDTMEAFLTARLRRSRTAVVADAVTRLLDDARPDVATLVDRSGLSHRRFNELFRIEVGMSAKRFSRVARFQQLLRLANGCTEVDWADLAVACGFYDQAHLVHEFRRHASMTPTAYMQRRTGRTNHPTAP